MKNIIAVKNIREYYGKHPDSKTSLENWLATAKSANWKKPSDVVATIPTADPIKNNRVVFNIAHNRYRLIVEIQYSIQFIYVCFIGTHPEYDKVDATTVNLY